MKKIIAVIALLATILSLAACKAKTPEERQAELSEKYEKQVQQSIKAEEEYQQGMDKYVDKFGKTEKGKRLVVKEPNANTPEYAIYEFDKDEVLKKRYKVLFFDNVEDYKIRLENGDGIMRELIDHDDKARMLKYEIDFEEDPQLTFDYYYNAHSLDELIEQGFEIIE